MPTIKDIAILARVSHAAVSHAIHKTRPVSAEIRGDVEAAIKRLNYFSGPGTRSSHRPSANIIGLLVSNSSNPFFAELAAGIEETCYRAGYCVSSATRTINPKGWHRFGPLHLSSFDDRRPVDSVPGETAAATLLERIRR